MPLPRTLFVLVATLATVLLVGNACTRRGGGGGPIPPTMSPPPTTYYVDPVKGNDKNSGTSPSSPFKTLTHALSFIKGLTTPGLTISMKAGQYTTRSGEVFPIAVPTGIVITGNGFGRGPLDGTFINGIGEDKALEKDLGQPSKTFYTTLEIGSGITSISLDDVYVGVTGALPSGATYNSVDVLGQLSATHVYFAAGTFGGLKVGGAVVPSGSLTCTACEMTGFAYALAAFSLGSANPPSIVLEGPGKSIIGGGIGILTDGSANVTVSSQAFASKVYAYSDQLAPHTSPAPSPTPFLRAHATSSPSPSPSTSPTAPPTGGVVDFGYGANSSGGNSLVGALRSEFFVTVPSALITAYGNTWNANAQGANPHGFYSRGGAFRAGAKGRNVTISIAATGAIVQVGPPPVTPTPSPTPSASPYGSPSPTPSP
jgi:hypothetical protein